MAWGIDEDPEPTVRSYTALYIWSPLFGAFGVLFLSMGVIRAYQRTHFVSSATKIPLANIKMTGYRTWVDEQQNSDGPNTKTTKYAVTAEFEITYGSDVYKGNLLPKFDRVIS
jgi:hypothetical protein